MADSGHPNNAGDQIILLLLGIFFGIAIVAILSGLAVLYQAIVMLLAIAAAGWWLNKKGMRDYVAAALAMIITIVLGVGLLLSGILPNSHPIPSPLPSPTIVEFPTPRPSPSVTAPPSSTLVPSVTPTHTGLLPLIPAPSPTPILNCNPKVRISSPKQDEIISSSGTSVPIFGTVSVENLRWIQLSFAPGREPLEQDFVINKDVSAQPMENTLLDTWNIAVAISNLKPDLRDELNHEHTGILRLKALDERRNMIGKCEIQLVIQ